MKLTVKEISDLVGGRLNGDGARVITGLAGLSDARPTDLSFLKDDKNKKAVETAHQAQAGCIIVPEGFSGNGKTTIEVKNPLGAFSKVLDVVDQARNPRSKPGVHKLSYVAPSAFLGKDVFIGPFAVVDEGAQIGDGARIDANVYIGPRSKVGQDSHLYPNVTIREDIVIGNRCIIHSGTVIGADGFGFYYSDKKHNKIPQIGNVIIEDDVEIGASTTIDRGMIGPTRIGKGTKIDNLVQIAHNVEVGEHSLIVAQVGIGGSTKIGSGVVLAGQVGVADHVKIGDGVQVGAQSGIKDDVAPKQVMWGTPAIPIADKIKEIILLRKLPSLFKKKED